jgi:hypothetical protein
MTMRKTTLIFLAAGLVGAWAESPGTFSRGPDKSVYKVSIPGKSWSVKIMLPSDFTIEGPDVSPDGDRVKLAGSDEATRLQFSLFLEKAATEGDARAAREFYWNRLQASPLKMEEVQLSEKDGAALLSYIVKRAGNRNIDWKSMHLFLSHDGYWLDVHLSKILFQPADQAYFDQILDSIDIVSTEPSSGPSENASKPYSVLLPQHGKLILNIPAPWKRSTKKAGGNLPPTIVLSPGKGDAFETLITPIWSPDNNPSFSTAPAFLKWAIEQHLEKMLPTAVEKDVKIREFSGVDGPGYYFLVTDKAPKPGEYPYAVFALARAGDLILNVTILCREKESEGIAATIHFLQEARQEKDK